MVFLQGITHLKPLHRIMLVMAVRLPAEVQHRKITHHVVRLLKKIDLVELVEIMTNLPKMIVIKNVTGTKAQDSVSKFHLFFSEMIGNIIHPPVVVLLPKIEDHHPIVHVIAVVIMNTNDLEEIENHPEIVMINTNVTHESTIFSKLRLFIRLFFLSLLGDIIEKKVDVIIEVMMIPHVVIVHHVEHHQRTFLHHPKLCFPITVNYHQQILLKFLGRMLTMQTMIQHPRSIQQFQHHHRPQLVDHVEKIPNVHLHVMVIIRNHRNVHDVTVMTNVVIVDVQRTNRVVKNPQIQQKFLLMLRNNQMNKNFS